MHPQRGRGFVFLWRITNHSLSLSTSVLFLTLSCKSNSQISIHVGQLSCVHQKLSFPSLLFGNHLVEPCSSQYRQAVVASSWANSRSDWASNASNVWRQLDASNVWQLDKAEHIVNGFMPRRAESHSNARTWTLVNFLSYRAAASIMVSCLILRMVDSLNCSCSNRRILKPPPIQIAPPAAEHLALHLLVRNLM